jgi:hypothetical protein
MLLRETDNWLDAGLLGIDGLSGDEHCVILTRGYIALIDPAYDQAVVQHNWFVMEQKNIVYAVRYLPRVDGKQKLVLMHREISQPSDEQDVDHKDLHKYFIHKIVDNRRSNLRNVSTSENQANQRKCVGCSSSFKGVTWDECAGKWRARITVNRRPISIGRFGCEVAAAKAYNVAHEHHFPGIYEGLNLIPE